MKNECDYELKGEELKKLREIAQEENKTVQELFIEIILEFIEKNSKNPKEKR